MTVDDIELLLTLETGLLNLPIRKPIDEELLKFPIILLTLDGPLDPQSLNENDFWRGSLHQHRISKLSKFIGSEEKEDMKAFVCAVRNSDLMDF